MWHPRFHVLAVLAFTGTAFIPIRALAQCSDWQPGFNLPGIGGTPSASVVFDDGTGSALYVAGDFRTAENVTASCVAKWDGSAWSSLGSGITDSLYNQPRVSSLAVFDDGSGPALYVVGWFNHAGGVYAAKIARWDGTNWSEVGGGLPLAYTVTSLGVFDDGNGPALYVGGNFAVPGAPSSGGIARWDGSAWTPLGSGFAGSINPRILCMTVFDDGSGPALYVGGSFTMAGAVNVSNIARWDGSTWSALGSGMDGDIRVLTAFDNGSGLGLYAGGSFTVAGGTPATGIARWNGSSWSALGSDLELPGGYTGVEALRVFNDGSRPALYAGGEFTLAGGASVKGIARWNGSTWSALGSGLDVSDAAVGASGWATTLEVFDDGSGSALYAGGEFDRAGGLTANHIARWNGSTWSPTGSGDGFLGDAQALAFFDDGLGSALYASRTYSPSYGPTVTDFVRWDGSNWAPVGGGIDGGGVLGMTVHDNGTTSTLCVGGTFSTAGGLSARCIACWDGQSWSPLGTGMETPGGSYTEVKALKTFDDGSGPALYAGGFFTMAGGVAANNIARWDGTSWTPLGSGVDGAVKALEVFDDGAGPALFAGGYFGFAGGASAYYIAKWNGTTWSNLGSGLNSYVRALAVVDLGAGPSLFVGGNFTAAGGGFAGHVARWNGSAWSSVGAGLDGFIYSLAGFDDGWGTAVYAGCTLTHSSPGIVKWDGSSWSPLGSGVSGGQGFFHYVFTLAVGDLDSDGVQDLCIGGNFGQAGFIGSNGIAAWRGCVHHGSPTCFGDGTGAPCPCGNSGFPGSGCNNAVGSGGARLNGAGAPSLGSDTLELVCTNLRPNVLCLVFQGDQPIAPLFDGDGLRCTGGNLKRLYVKTAYGSVVTAPQSGDLSVSARSAALGDPLFAGATRLYQVYYRDKNPTFCPNPPGNTWNVSSGLRVDWLQ